MRLGGNGCWGLSSTSQARSRKAMVWRPRGLLMALNGRCPVLPLAAQADARERLHCRSRAATIWLASCQVLIRAGGALATPTRAPVPVAVVRSSVALDLRSRSHGNGSFNPGCAALCCGGGWADPCKHPGGAAAESAESGLPRR